MPDVYFKKVIDFQYKKQQLHFRVSQDLFSSHQVDMGSARLLRSLAHTEGRAFHKILDLGCGYGSLGLTLKKLDEARGVCMVDRDALAIEYSRQNAVLNQLSDVDIHGSLGYDDVRSRDFDLIISNIPGKAGEVVIRSFLLDAQRYLNPAGFVALVAVTPLEPLIAGILESPHIHVTFKEARAGHVIFHYQFSPEFNTESRPGEPASAHNLYDRERVVISTGDIEFSMQTARGLPEFDQLNYHTKLLINGIQALQGKPVKRVLVFNPGQGHVPVALWKLFEPHTMGLVDRDLLSLRYAKRNLALNGCPDTHITLSHQVGMQSQNDAPFRNSTPLLNGAPADLIAGILRESEGPEAVALTVKQAVEYLTPKGTLLVSGGSTAVTRLVDVLQAEKKIRIQKRKRNKGKSLLVLVRR